MRCGDFSELIHGYLDRELDLVRSLEVEEHLKNCPACSQVYQQQQALHSALGSGDLCFAAPPRLRKMVRSAVREASRAEAPRSFWSTPWFRWSIPVGFALALVLALILIRPSGGEEPVSQQVVAAQEELVQTDHLTDVASADPYVVNSWFYKKLGFGAPAVDLAAHGFPLLGGRTETIDNHAAAVVVYHYEQRPIGLFVWPLKDTESTPEKNLRYQGHHLVHWTQAGLSCWAVSGLDQAKLRSFVQLVQKLGYTSESIPKDEGTGIYKYP